MNAATHKEQRLLQVLLAPVISEKATNVADKNEQVIFKVTADATKPEIKAAVELLFKVEVESVQVAKDFLGGQRVRRLEASTHFHSQSIRAPGWTRQMRVAQQVGQHIFFNDKSVELKNS